MNTSASSSSSKMARRKKAVNKKSKKPNLPTKLRPDPMKKWAWNSGATPITPPPPMVTVHQPDFGFRTPPHVPSSSIMTPRFSTPPRTPLRTIQMNRQQTPRQIAIQEPLHHYLNLVPTAAACVPFDVSFDVESKS